MRDSGSGRVIALVVVFLLLVGGGVVGLKLYAHFKPRLVGGITTPTTSLQADHVYNLPVRYRTDVTPGVRIDAIHVPTVTGLDLTMYAVDCKAGVAKAAITEGPNLANSVYAPKLSPKAYYAQIVHKLYGSKIGTVAHPTICGVLSVHARKAGSYHLGALTLDWRAGLFVGKVRDHTDATFTFH